MGEWEWCLVLLEELEQQEDEDSDDAARGGGEGGDDDDAHRKQGAAGSSDATVLTLELDEAGMPVGIDTDGYGGSGGGGGGYLSGISAAESSTVATYNAAIRACGEGGSGVRAVTGILERMRWAGVEPGEGTYVEALRAFQLCGVHDGGGDVEGLAGGGVGGDGGEGISAGEAAGALIAWENRNGGRASVFVYR